MNRRKSTLKKISVTLDTDWKGAAMCGYFNCMMGFDFFFNNFSQIPLSDTVHYIYFIVDIMIYQLLFKRCLFCPSDLPSLITWCLVQYRSIGTETGDFEHNRLRHVAMYFFLRQVLERSESSRQGVGTVLASSNVAASHLLGNYLT